MFAFPSAAHGSGEKLLLHQFHNLASTITVIYSFVTLNHPNLTASGA
jgi:hypothetical protein